MQTSFARRALILCAVIGTGAVAPTAASAAGLNPPAYFGTEVVARQLAG